MYSLTRPMEAPRLLRTESPLLRLSKYPINQLVPVSSRVLLIKPTTKLVTELPLPPFSLEPSSSKGSRKSNQELTQPILNGALIKQSNSSLTN